MFYVDLEMLPCGYRLEIPVLCECQTSRLDSIRFFIHLHDRVFLPYQHYVIYSIATGIVVCPCTSEEVMLQFENGLSTKVLDLRLVGAKCWVTTPNVCGQMDTKQHSIPFVFVFYCLGIRIIVWLYIYYKTAYICFPFDYWWVGL